MVESVSYRELEALYRLMLGRATPDPAELYASLARGWDLSRWLSELSGMSEHHWQIFPWIGNQQFWHDPHNIVEIDASDRQLEALESRQRENWEYLGRTTPHFSVMTNPMFLPDELSAAKIDEFYYTGHLDVQAFEKRLRRHGIWPAANGMVLDWGCGVGRLAQHLTAHPFRYVGVDASAPHRRLAADRMGYLGRDNAEFRDAASFLACDNGERFDAIVSVLVFQHTPPPLMAKELRAVLSRLKPGGGAYMQVPTFLEGYSFKTDAYLASPPPLGSIEMHALPQSVVLDIVSSLNHDIIEVVFDGRVGNMGWSHGFVVRGGKNT